METQALNKEIVPGDQELNFRVQGLIFYLGWNLDGFKGVVRLKNNFFKNALIIFSF